MSNNSEPIKTLHGLPEQVIFCSRCVMNNQRPNTSREFVKKDSNISTAGFGDDGVCDACRWYEEKQKIDWADREKQLQALCDKFRRNDGRYDVIVPSSGGKDSFFVAHQLKHKYGMNPLTVTWAPHRYTDVGWRNFQSMIDAGFDNVLVTPNSQVHAKLTRLAFENLVNPFQPFIIGQKNVAPRAALQYNVPLIMYGENHAEAHNKIGENYSPLMNIEHFTRENDDTELYFGGVNIKDLKQYSIEDKDLFLYKPLLAEPVRKAGIEVHYYSFYYNWSPQENYYYAMDNSKFESNPDGRSEGTYSKFSSLDDKIDGQHYFTMFAKFGQGRCMNDANRDIRDGLITREEAIKLMNKYDGEFPKKYFQEFLDYIGISEERYWEVIDKSRSPHVWKKVNGEWVLKHRVS
ncbi:MAG: N-acetyl sugar amidotransferase [Bacteroidetes bacterium]|nr:N-acetyl sugar amidotransferase [Bacteroidota bacterium]